jgi:hypothetical protein
MEFKNSEKLLETGVGVNKLPHTHTHTHTHTHNMSRVESKPVRGGGRRSEKKEEPPTEEEEKEEEEEDRGHPARGGEGKLRKKRKQ